jgi:hypothetical protein
LWLETNSEYIEIHLVHSHNGRYLLQKRTTKKLTMADEARAVLFEPTLQALAPPPTPAMPLDIEQGQQKNRMRQFHEWREFVAGVGLNLCLISSNEMRPSPMSKHL